MIYDWSHNYLFLPLLECGYSEGFAEFIVMVISAATYEYMICVCLGFFYPVLFVTFAGLFSFSGLSLSFSFISK